jgi:small subunit ribosomal protein S4
MNLNGKNITIPSIIVKPGDVIKPKKEELFKEISLNTANSWIEADSKKMTGTIKHLPTKDEIDTQINASLIIEFYSR